MARREETGEGRRNEEAGAVRLASSASRLPAGAVAVLALQGDFAAHGKRLRELGLPPVEVRWPQELSEAYGLVLPGGESTTIWKFFESAPWEEAIRRFAAAGRPVLATCAGTIVLAREVSNPVQKGLSLVDIAVERNAYGRQVDSFVADVEAPALGGALPAVFIRAPRIHRVGSGVSVLARWKGDPVLVRQGAIVAATFHPELTGDERVHRLAFADLLDARKSA